jgi:hypothetical protein
MSIQVNWDTPERNTVRYEFSAHWTWEEFFAAVAQSKYLIDTEGGDHVAVIMDASVPHIQVPPNLITHTKKALGNKHPKTCAIIVVMNNAFLRVMVNTVVTLSSGNGRVVFMVDTLEKAREIARDQLHVRTLLAETDLS